MIHTMSYEYIYQLTILLRNPCAIGSLSPAFDEALQSGDIEISDDKDEAVYCVARFFVFHAKVSILVKQLNCSFV